MKTLSQILRIAQTFHPHHNTSKPNFNTTGYMCHAIDDALIAGYIDKAEQGMAKNYAKDVVKTISPRHTSLAGALQHLKLNLDRAGERQAAAQIWEAVITDLELEEQQGMLKIRHYRNTNIIGYDVFADEGIEEVVNIGGATIAFRDLPDGKVELGLAVCVENFSRKEGIKRARFRLNRYPVIVDAEELSGIFTMEDLMFSDLGDKLTEVYKKMGINIDLYKAFTAGF